MARKPDSPSMTVSRMSAAVRPTSAIRRACPLQTRSWTHSTPLLVFPKPRPATIAHTCQSPGGGSCSALAQAGQT